MLSVTFVAIIAITSVWVYLDATANSIGKIPDAKGMFNMSAGAWAIVTLGIWIIGFPAYLIKRGSLIAAAKTQPVTVKARIVKLVLSAVAGYWILNVLVVTGAIFSYENAVRDSQLLTMRVVISGVEVAETLYYADNYEYTRDLAALARLWDFSFSTVSVEIGNVTAEGYSVRATNSVTSDVCTASVHLAEETTTTCTD